VKLAVGAPDPCIIRFFRDHFDVITITIMVEAVVKGDLTELDARSIISLDKFLPMTRKGVRSITLMWN
jgi:hypothetical protein